MIKIAPSILSADFLKLGEDILTVSNADYIHFDVMDGVFVPNISFGLPVLEAVRRVTELPLDVHLMIDRPVRYVERFIAAGADIVTVHFEADEPENIKKALELIKAAGKKAGLSLKPKTPADMIEPYIDMLDLALIMTVEPGFGGQSFMADQMDKVRAVRKMIEDRGLDCELEVDGGVNLETAKVCTAAGADVLVAGSDIFKAKDREGRITKLRG